MSAMATRLMMYASYIHYTLGLQYIVSGILASKG